MEFNLTKARTVALLSLTLAQSLLLPSQATSTVRTNGDQKPGSESILSSSLKATPPLFVQTASKVAITAEVNAGDISRANGSQTVMIFHFAPQSNDYRELNSNMTLDGNIMKAVTNLDSQKRPLFYAYGTPTSGKIRLAITGTLYERVIGIKDKLPSQVELSDDQKSKYLAQSKEIQTQNHPSYSSRMKLEGLVRRVDEKPWDYLLRTSEYLKVHFDEGILDIPTNSRSNSRIFDAKKLSSEDATLFLARLARNNNIPFRCLLGLLLQSDGKADPYVIGEFYDAERGWVPVNGGAIIGKGKKDPVLATFGRDVPECYKLTGERFVPIIDNSGVEITVTDPRGNIGPKFYNEFFSGFYSGILGQEGGGPLPQDSAHIFFSKEHFLYNSTNGSWGTLSNRVNKN